jgi:hypothetical protein
MKLHIDPRPTKGIIEGFTTPVMPFLYLDSEITGSKGIIEY